MPEYTVHAVEEFIDAFEEIEGYQPLAPVVVEACSIQEAEEKARGLIDRAGQGDIPPGGALAMRVFKIEGNGEILQRDLPERL